MVGPKFPTMLLCVFLVAGPVLAEAAENREPLCIEYIGPDERPTDGVTFQAYEVGMAHGSAIWLEEPYSAYADVIDGGSDDALATAATALEKQIAEERRQPDATATTDDDGRAVFPPMPEGVYLIAGEETDEGDEHFKPQAFLSQASGVAHPKAIALASGDQPVVSPTVVPATEEEATPEETTPPADEGVFAKTGDIVAAVGALGAVVGLVSAALAGRCGRRS